MEWGKLTIKVLNVFIAPIVPGRMRPSPSSEESLPRNFVVFFGFMDSSVLNSSSLRDSSLSTSTALISCLTLPARIVRSIDKSQLCLINRENSTYLALPS